jgi:hypothetical protein
LSGGLSSFPEILGVLCRDTSLAREPRTELVKVERGELDFRRHEDLLFEDEIMTKLRPHGQIVA